MYPRSTSPQAAFLASEFVRLAIAIAIFITFPGIPAQAEVPSRDGELLEAQIENQRAQAQYYQKQVSEPSDGWWDSSSSGTILGAVAAIVGGLISTWLQWRHERKVGSKREIQLALADLTRGLARGIHAIAWCTWKAEYEPAQLGAKDFAAYDREIKGLFPAIVGAKVLLAACDQKAHGELEPIVKRLYKLDRKLASAGLSFRAGDDEDIAQIKSYYKELKDLDKDLFKISVEVAKTLQPNSWFKRFSRPGAQPSSGRGDNETNSSEAAKPVSGSRNPIRPPGSID